MNDREILTQLKETKDISLAIQEYRKEHGVSEVYAKTTLRELIQKSRKFGHYEKVCLLRNELLQPPPKPNQSTDWKGVIVYVIGFSLLIFPFILLFHEYGLLGGLGILMGTYLTFEFFMRR